MRLVCALVPLRWAKVLEVSRVRRRSGVIFGSLEFVQRKEDVLDKFRLHAPSIENLFAPLEVKRILFPEKKIPESASAPRKAGALAEPSETIRAPAFVNEMPDAART